MKFEFNSVEPESTATLSGHRIRLMKSSSEYKTVCAKKFTVLCIMS